MIAGCIFRGIFLQYSRVGYVLSGFSFYTQGIVERESNKKNTISLLYPPKVRLKIGVAA